MARLYTECLWKIQLDNKQNVIHELSFKVFNVTERIPSIQECIELHLPPNMSFESWDTKVEDRSFDPGYGYIERDNIYRLKFSDIENISRAPEINVKVSFHQKQAVIKMGNVNIFDLDFKSEFHSSSIEVSVCPPEVVALWRKILSNAIGLLTRKKLVKCYDIQFFGHSPRIDYEKGRIIYQQRQITRGSGIFYKSISSIELRSFIVGVILTFIIELVLVFLLRYFGFNYFNSNASLQ